MKKIYHLATCSTCQRIIGEINSNDIFELQNIKEQHITASELDQYAKVVGGYEALFNKRAMKYRSMGLNKMVLTEKEFRKHILAEYTFLKRPLVIIDKQVFAGNAKRTVQAIKEAL